MVYQFNSQTLTLPVFEVWIEQKHIPKMANEQCEQNCTDPNWEPWGTPDNSCEGKWVSTASEMLTPPVSCSSWFKSNQLKAFSYFVPKNMRPWGRHVLSWLKIKLYTAATVVLILAEVAEVLTNV